MSYDYNKNPEDKAKALKNIESGKWITMEKFRELKVGDIITHPTSKRDWDRHIDIPGVQKCRILKIYYDNVGNGCISADVIEHAYEPDIENFEKCTGYTDFLYSPKLLDESPISTEVPSTLLIRRVLMLAEKFRNEHTHDLSLTIQQHWNDFI